MRSLRWLALAALTLCAAPSFAASFTVLGWDAGEVIRANFNGQNKTYLTTQFHEQVGGVVGTSFCADLAQTIGKATYSNFTSYDPADAEGRAFANGRDFTFAATIADEWSHKLGKLEHQLGVTHVQAITGVQAAIWEAVYGTSFTVTQSSMSAGAFHAFQYVLGYGGYGNYGKTRLFHSRTHQDQLFTPPVPEPSSMIVFGAGALLVGGSLLRRRARA